MDPIVIAKRELAKRIGRAIWELTLWYGDKEISTQDQLREHDINSNDVIYVEIMPKALQAEFEIAIKDYNCLRERKDELNDILEYQRPGHDKMECEEELKETKYETEMMKFMLRAIQLSKRRKQKDLNGRSLLRLVTKWNVPTIRTNKYFTYRQMLENPFEPWKPKNHVFDNWIDAFQQWYERCKKEHRPRAQDIFDFLYDQAYKAEDP